MTTATTLPASIRHKNPGAMGLGSSAKRFGATKQTRLNDGAGNVIATFPTSVDGAGALFHLLYSAYAQMTVWDALHKWGDGKTLEAKGQVMQARMRTDGYASAIERFSSWRRSDVLSQGLLRDPERAIDFARAMSRHEAGGEYPMTDADWVEAHQQFMTVLGGGQIALDRVKPLPVTAPLEMAKTYLGERRILGPGTNKRIEDLFKEIGSQLRGDDDSFCAAGTGACLKLTGHAYIAGAAGQLAKSYLNYGHALDEPEEGCIVVQWRESPSSWKGHVEFVESWTATHLTVIGFNRGGAVVRATIPRLASNGGRVLAYRRPVLAVRPASEILREDSIGQKVVGGFGAVCAFLWSVWNGIVWCATNAGEVLGLLPETAANVSSNVAAGQQIAEAAGMPWPVQLALAVTICSLAFGLYRSWKRLRPNSGALTRPPYETDPAVDEPVVERQIELAFSEGEWKPMGEPGDDVVATYPPEAALAGAGVPQLATRRRKRSAPKKPKARKAAKRGRAA